MILTNQKKITEILKITGSSWNFYILDFYGDKGATSLPNIEELDKLCFKFVGKKLLTKSEEKRLIYEINELDIGKAEIWKTTYFGKYIVVSV